MTATFVRSLNVPGSTFLREAAGPGITAAAAQPILAGRLAAFRQWAEIRSPFEGNFLERIERGAFLRTFLEDRTQLKLMFGHGLDPRIGTAVLGQIISLREDEIGASYEAVLFPTPITEELLPGLRAGAYGNSFRFRPVSDVLVQRPPRSEHNPHGLPERTLTEVRVVEFGPCSLPAYAGTTAWIAE